MKQFIGALLLGCGILLAGLSGLCSLLMLFDPATWNGPAASESLSIVAFVGGIPFVIGFGMAFLGRRLLKQDPPGPGTGTPEGPLP